VCGQSFANHLTPEVDAHEKGTDGLPCSGEIPPDKRFLLTPLEMFRLKERGKLKILTLFQTNKCAV
jgi:hypothetical protein